MARLIFSAIVSLDGYVNDAEGRFNWAMPSDEVHAAVNDLTRPIGTFLLGRRMYDVMSAWDSIGDGPDHPDEIRDFAGIWRAADKVVYSRELPAPTNSRTRIEREFTPEAIEVLKGTAERDLAVAGPGLAAHAFRTGLVDEVQLVIVPMLIGGGTRALPEGVRGALTLLDERRFADGAMLLRYLMGSSYQGWQGSQPGMTTVGRASSEA